MFASMRANIRPTLWMYRPAEAEESVFAGARPGRMRSISALDFVEISHGNGPWHAESLP
jgi:hypothetical protein